MCTPRDLYFDVMAPVPVVQHKGSWVIRDDLSPRGPSCSAISLSRLVARCGFVGSAALLVVEDSHNLALAVDFGLGNSTLVCLGRPHAV